MPPKKKGKTKKPKKEPAATSRELSTRQVGVYYKKYIEPMLIGKQDVAAAWLASTPPDDAKNAWAKRIYENAQAVDDKSVKISKTNAQYVADRAYKKLVKLLFPKGIPKVTTSNVKIQSLFDPVSVREKKEKGGVFNPFTQKYNPKPGKDVKTNAFGVPITQSAGSAGAAPAASSGGVLSGIGSRFTSLIGGPKSSTFG